MSSQGSVALYEALCFDYIRSNTARLYDLLVNSCLSFFGDSSPTCWLLTGGETLTIMLNAHNMYSTHNSCGMQTFMLIASHIQLRTPVGYCKLHLTCMSSQGAITDQDSSSLQSQHHGAGS